MVRDVLGFRSQVASVTAQGRLKGEYRPFECRVGFWLHVTRNAEREGTSEIADPSRVV